MSSAAAARMGASSPKVMRPTLLASYAWNRDRATGSGSGWNNSATPDCQARCILVTCVRQAALAALRITHEKVVGIDDTVAVGVDHAKQHLSQHARLPSQHNA